MVEAKHVVNEIQRRPQAKLSVFWVTVMGGRDDFAKVLKRERGPRPIVPYILRKSELFVSSDSVMADILEVLECIKKEIGEVKDAGEIGGVDIVVLSRKPLMVIDGSSPVELPTWFPVAGGRLVSADVEDLTWSASVYLKDAETGLMEVGDLCQRLHEIDRALVRRLRESLIERGEGSVRSLWDRVRHKSCPYRISVEFLEQVETRLERIQDVSGYRPSCRPGSWTVVELLWFKANSTTADELPRLAEALAKGLRIEVVKKRATLMAVLSRPTNPIEDASAEWCFFLIVTLRGACQLTTAVAHSSGYPPFPVALLRSVSEDLRRFLRDATKALKRGRVGP